MCLSGDWIKLAQDTVQWRALVKTGFTKQGIINFSRTLWSVIVARCYQLGKIHRSSVGIHISYDQDTWIFMFLQLSAVFHLQTSSLCMSSLQLVVTVKWD
jgi:hypothetical protein